MRRAPVLSSFLCLGSAKSIADRTTDTERAAAVAFARRQLEKRLQHPVQPFFEVSAAEQLEHRGTGRDWGKLVEALRLLVEGSGRRLIQAACERGLERISEQLLVIITEETRGTPATDRRFGKPYRRYEADHRRCRAFDAGARISLHGRATASLRTCLSIATKHFSHA